MGPEKLTLQRAGEMQLPRGPANNPGDRRQPNSSKPHRQIKNTAAGPLRRWPRHSEEAQGLYFSIFSLRSAGVASRNETA